MSNHIYLYSNSSKESVSEIKGLNIVFKGKNSEVMIEEGSNFISSKITLHNNCRINISKTNEYGIRNLYAQIFDNCKINIGKDFSCVSLKINLLNEKGLSLLIGDYCMCGHNVIIRPSDGHILYDMNTKELLNKGEDVFIGNHVWIGLNCIFLKGAKVSDDSIIGANSLVNKKFYEKNVIIAGSPAKIVKRDVNWDRKSPERYDEFIGNKKNERNHKSLVNNDSVYVERKFDKLLSFLYISKKENLNPKNIYKIYKARGQIKSLNLFDENYYLNERFDVKNFNLSPLDHYIYHGWMEKRNPSIEFDGDYYLKRYPDIERSKINPLVHYVLYGIKEGRFPNYHVEINSHSNK